MLDSIVFEQQGIPSASIITHVFRATGAAMARTWGLEGFRFLEMQHPIANLTLRKQLLESPEGLLGLARDVAAGLAHMHSRGLIHRDLSLRNVFLSQDCRAIIGDLGLTRFVDEKGEYPLDGHSSKSARYLPNLEVRQVLRVSSIGCSAGT